MTEPINILNVKPKIPKTLHSILELSNNLWFFWHHDAHELFRRMNTDIWEETNKNPVELLNRLKQYELEALSVDEGFLAHMERLKREFDCYMSEKPDPMFFGEKERQILVAYFTAECGVADCLPIYSGGLGVLSGDHLKSASDLNLPIIGVSLAYQKGYFRQYLTRDGWQMETYPENNFATMPMNLVKDDNGKPLRVILELKGEKVYVQAWRVNVGRTVLYLLDTNIDKNTGSARAITAELYGGDKEMRIRQEIILGIGGVKMLGAMGLDPSVYHINEGHSAFATFERMRQLVEDKGLSFNEACEFVRVTNIFTTHTPVATGIDTFHPELMRHYFESFTRSLKTSFDTLLGLGRQNPKDKEEDFCMTVLALRLSIRNNAVSKLHASVSKKMWQRIWPNIPETDLPIVHITNGIHIPSWISKGMAENYDRYLGPRWIEDPDNARVWEQIDKIPDTELWRTHERAKERLVTFTRKRLRKQLESRGVSDRDLAGTNNVLNTEILTIGFARRFTAYKRANLILKNIGRLERILTNKECPVQIIFAGKAHPHDETGKEFIKNLVEIAGQERMRRHIVFLEDYDMETARYMVQGVDIWLNTPRRPLEACGTSGMKAVANGALHLSVLDGWWDEGYERKVGWAIGNGEEYEDSCFQDELESKALYDILEKDIIPLYYERSPDNLPIGWLAMTKASLHKLCPLFNTHRMVEEYWEKFYFPAAEQGQQFAKNDYKNVKDLTIWCDKVVANWEKIAIEAVRMDKIEELEVGHPYKIEADIFLGKLSPGDVMVEAYYGTLDSFNQFVDGISCTMKQKKSAGEYSYTYQCQIEFQEAGHFGLNVRLAPNHPNPLSRHSMGLVKWGKK